MPIPDDLLVAQVAARAAADNVASKYDLPREAGCLFSGWQGQPWDGKDNFILVARPEIHRYLVNEIRDLC
jgi:hypothetical protein